MIENIFNLLLQRKDFFVELVVEHILISAVVIFAAIFFGIFIGVFISEYKKFSQPTLGTVNFLYTIPSISMLGFLIPIFGVGNFSAIVALIIYALLPIVRSTYTGISQIDKGIIEAAQALGLKNFTIIFNIKLPIALPIIMSGIRNMVVMTISLAGIASFIGAGGLGVAIYRGITTNNSAMTIAGSFLIALMALLADFLIGLLEKKKNFLKFAAVIGIFIIIFGFVNNFADKKDTIHIATKPMTEQYILGEMMKLMIENETNLQVELTSGVGGGTSNIMPAMISGEFDLYPEYTGTAWNMILKRENLYSENFFDELAESFHEDYKMRWLGMYGFNDTYGLVVRREIAEKFDLKTYSDLQKISNQLTFGAEYDFFEREDGYNALCKNYKFNFAKTMDLDIGLKYKALENNQVDVMIIFTTDGQLSQSDSVVLVDDKNFFPSYMCGNIIREEILIQHPELENILNKFTSIISDSEMAQMNYFVESEGQEPKNVAKNFLKSKGLID